MENSFHFHTCAICVSCTYHSDTFQNPPETKFTSKLTLPHQLQFTMSVKNLYGKKEKYMGRNIKKEGRKTISSHIQQVV